MSAVNQAKDCYRRNTLPIKSHRAIEYEAIARISHRMRSSEINKKNSYPEFVDALSENKKLWTTLVASVASKDNKLPQDLRARLLWLGEFVFQEVDKILKTGGNVDVLIDINSAILQGLNTKEDTL